ncbi:hypothetical protein LRE75_17495 [Streptomyces sp. 372A]
MAATSSPRSSFRTITYWAALEAIADDLINHTVDDTARPSWDASDTLRRLSGRGFGALSLFDLCALLVLAVPRTAIEPAVSPPPATASTQLRRGPVTVTTHATDSHAQHLQELEGAVAEALLIDPGAPSARDAARRALMARGRSVRDAITVYGIVCQFLPPAAA